MLPLAPTTAASCVARAWLPLVETDFLHGGDRSSPGSHLRNGDPKRSRRGRGTEASELAASPYGEGKFCHPPVPNVRLLTEPPVRG